MGPGPGPPQAITLTETLAKQHASSACAPLLICQHPCHSKDNRRQRQFHPGICLARINETLRNLYSRDIVLSSRCLSTWDLGVRVAISGHLRHMLLRVESNTLERDWEKCARYVSDEEWVVTSSLRAMGKAWRPAIHL